MFTHPYYPIFCRFSSYFYLFDRYLHTKSIAHSWPDLGAADRWRRHLELLLTSDHGVRSCAAGIASGADVCGGEWEEKPWPHFSGNMWTASCRYISTLPSPTSLLPITQSNWGAMEAWIGSGRNVLVWHLGSAYTGNKYIQMPKFDGERVLHASWQLATCIRPQSQSCRPDIGIMTHLFRVTPQLLLVTVRIPCSCIRHVSKDEVRVILKAFQGNVQIGVIRIYRNIDGGPSAVCSFSESFPVALSLKREHWQDLEVLVEVLFDMGTHNAVAQDQRQVTVLLLWNF